MLIEDNRSSLEIVIIDGVITHWDKIVDTLTFDFYFLYIYIYISKQKSLHEPVG